MSKLLKDKSIQNIYYRPSNNEASNTSIKKLVCKVIGIILFSIFISKYRFKNKIVNESENNPHQAVPSSAISPSKHLISLPSSIAKKQLKIGVVGLNHCLSIGNNLLKYAISHILKEMGFIPYLIGTRTLDFNPRFLSSYSNVIVIKSNFSEIKKDDYDILMVNSDQTWRKFDKHMLDYGFLRFAENWTMPKFIYGASLGYDYWDFTVEEENIAKRLLKQFKGISIREQDSLDLVKEHLGIAPEVVLDPTFLVHKNNYLELAKNSNKTIDNNEKYIFLYKLWFPFPRIETFAREVSREFNYKIYKLDLYKDTVEDFLYYVNNSQAVITNSFHGAVFSIIFNKPFLTLYKNGQAEKRFKSLGNLFHVKNRLISNSEIPDVNLLKTPLDVNYSLLEELKAKSLNFLKKNLEVA